MKTSTKFKVIYPLLLGSLIMTVGGNVANVVNYLYNLILGRLLGPADYGALATLFSLIGLLGMIPFSLGMAIVKTISAAKTQQEVENSVRWLNKRIIIVSIGMFLFICAMTPIIAPFVKVNNKSLIILISFSFLFSIPSFFNKSVLQGVLKFKENIISTLIEVIFKLLLSTLLVFLGLGILGAIIGFIGSSFIGWIISRIFVRNFSLIGNEKKPQIKKFLLFCIPILIQSFAMTSLYSTDLVLVKHYFSAQDTGIYAALSYLGRVIFFGCGPIASVMFPLVAQKQAKGQNYMDVFYFSLGVTTVISCGVVIIYWLFPRFAVNMLYGSLYLNAANYLIWFGFSMFFYTLSSLFISFHLSLANTKVVIFPALAAIFQIVGIILFHSNLMSVIKVLIFDNLFLLLALSLFHYLKTNKKNQALDLREDIYILSTKGV